jgi:hypothetical protein
MITPVTLHVERMRLMALNPHVGHGIVVGDLFAAIVPQAFQSVVNRLLAVYLVNMLLERL